LFEGPTPISTPGPAVAAKGVTSDPVALLGRVRAGLWTLPLAAITALVIFGINEAAYVRSSAALTE
jgi:hypothetical protein